MDRETILIACVILLSLISIGCIFAVYRAEKDRRLVLERELSAKADFLSKISYDIRTPMNAIIGAAALGMEEVENPDKMRMCLNQITSSSQFLMGLMNDLVDMTKIEDGKFYFHPSSYAYSDFIDEIKTIIVPLCRRKNIQFEMPDEDINVNFEVDKQRLKQIFFNLLTNAVKFTPERGTVSFRICNYATHNNTFSADYIVEDTGIGMDAEFQKILFASLEDEKDGKIRAGRNGIGLGLAITRTIVNLMGGTIELESEVGKGTKVKVHLDIELAAIQPEKKLGLHGESEIRQILKGKRVLLVEDHPLNIEITKRVLEKEEMQVFCAENGKVAVEMLEKEDAYFFDLILMDIKMPVMNGVDATKEIRHMPCSYAQLIPILAMTADANEDDVMYYKDMGMNGYIAKPLEPQNLYLVMCEYLIAR